MSFNRVYIFSLNGIISKLLLIVLVVAIFCRKTSITILFGGGGGCYCLIIPFVCCSVPAVLQILTISLNPSLRLKVFINKFIFKWWALEESYVQCHFKQCCNSSALQ